MTCDKTLHKINSLFSAATSSATLPNTQLLCGENQDVVNVNVSGGVGGVSGVGGDAEAMMRSVHNLQLIFSIKLVGVDMEKGLGGWRLVLMMRPLLHPGIEYPIIAPLDF